MFSATNPVPSSDIVATAEAAFIANLDDKSMQKLFDEHIVPAPFVLKADGWRKYTRLAAAFAKFYFEEDQVFTTTARREVIKQLSARVLSHRFAADITSLRVIEPIDWIVVIHEHQITVAKYVWDVRARQTQVDRARELIVEDPEIMGGVPTFKGTRVPVSIVADLVKAGEPWSTVREDYPSISEEMFEAAATYQAINPRRGRPPTQSPSSGWKLKSRKIVKPARPQASE